MEKMVQCKYWKEYQGLNGWVMFCGAGAFARKLTELEAKICGCTVEQRAACKKSMEVNLGYGLVPEVLTAEKPQRSVKVEEEVAARV